VSADCHFVKEQLMKKGPSNSNQSASADQQRRQKLQAFVDIVNKGVDCYEQGDLDSALVHLNRAINLNPSSAEAYANRGGIYNTKKNLDLALMDLNEAIRLKPDFAPAYANRGLVYYNRKDYERARADWEQTLRLDPQFPDIRKKLENLRRFSQDRKLAELMKRGVDAASKGDPDQALADFNEAVRLDPDNADAYMNRGNSHSSIGSLDQAMDDYNKAIGLRPDYAAAYVNRGNLYEMQKDYARAREDWEQALRLDPKMLFAREGIERLRQAGNREGEAGNMIRNFEYRKDTHKKDAYNLYVDGKATEYHIVGAPIQALRPPPAGVTPAHTLWLGDVGLSRKDPPRPYLALGAALQKETALAEQFYRQKDLTQ
jgi:tetratricopeptide (TPR) repeat protein